MNVRLRRDGRLFRLVGPSVLAVATAAAAVVWARTEVTTLRYECASLLKQEARLRVEVEKLQLERAALAAPDRIEAGARKLGLVDPRPEQVVLLGRLADRAVQVGAGPR
ncbi:MAG: cell division protein FtsL [Myxococcota bacterium]